VHGKFSLDIFIVILLSMRQNTKPLVQIKGNSTGDRSVQVRNSAKDCSSNFITDRHVYLERGHRSTCVDLCHLTPKKKRPKKKNAASSSSRSLHTLRLSLSLSHTHTLSLSLARACAYLSHNLFTLLTLCATHAPTHSQHAYV
jgi:hypothetical protein